MLSPDNAPIRNFVFLSFSTRQAWNLAVFGTGAINGWDKVKITHWDNSITAL